MIRLTKLDRAQISEFAKSPQQIKYFEALQTNVSELPDAIAILTAAVAEAQADADIATTSANEALTLANQKGQDDFLPEMVIQPVGDGDAISSATTGAATKATPVDADLIPLVDSAAAYTLKNLMWANLKATLKTYFDSVVTTLTNKTIALGNNTISGTLAQFNTAVTDADLASLAGVETLTNKTINLTSNTLVATSAQLAAALTDETGSGAAVFASSPALVGVPTGPTAAAGTNTTQLSTTAFVNNVVTGPAFSAYPSSAQSIPSGTSTKVQVDTELFDTASAFDSTTNYRFTPLVAGYYQVSVGFYMTSSSGQIETQIRKNGATEAAAPLGFNTVANSSHISTLVFMNGTSDYLEFFVFQNSGGSLNLLASRPDINYFRAFLARAA